MDVPNTIAWKWPGCEFSVGDDYESLQWLDKKVPKPTEQEVKDAALEYKKHKEDTQYLRDRIKAYGDPIELLMMLHEDKKGLGLGTSFVDFMDSVDAQYPKPQ